MMGLRRIMVANRLTTSNPSNTSVASSTPRIQPKRTVNGKTSRAVWMLLMTVNCKVESITSRMAAVTDVWSQFGMGSRMSPTNVGERLECSMSSLMLC